MDRRTVRRYARPPRPFWRLSVGRQRPFVPTIFPPNGNRVYSPFVSRSDRLFAIARRDRIVCPSVSRYANHRRPLTALVWANSRNAIRFHSDPFSGGGRTVDMAALGTHVIIRPGSN